MSAVFMLPILANCVVKQQLQRGSPFHGISWRIQQSSIGRQHHRLLKSAQYVRRVREGTIQFFSCLPTKICTLLFFSPSFPSPPTPPYLVSHFHYHYLPPASNSSLPYLLSKPLLLPLHPGVIYFHLPFFVHNQVMCTLSFHVPHQALFPLASCSFILQFLSFSPFLQYHGSHSSVFSRRISISFPFPYLPISFLYQISNPSPFSPLSFHPHLSFPLV